MSSSSQNISDVPACLVLILDLHPVSWSTKGASGGGNGGSMLSLDRALDVLLVFVNGHLALRNGNELVLYVALQGGKSELVYASPPPSSHHHHESAIEESPDAPHRRPLPPNASEPFYATQEAVRARIKQLFADQSTAGSSRSGGPGIVSALLRALCHANRLDPASSANGNGEDVDGGAGIANVRSSTTGHHAAADATGLMGMETRIMIVSNTPEQRGNGGGGGPGGGGGGGGGSGGGYVGLMNAVFAAQKRKTPIDVFDMRPAADGSSQDEKTISNGSSVSSSGGGSTVFLQQAAHLTHGMYYRLPKGAGMAGSSAGAGDGAEASAAAMLMYLNLIFLPPPSLRSHIGLPSQDRVDFRAVCFCHQRVVDVGFVCSVCLSIFCSPLPICTTCKSRFPIQSVQQLKKALPSAAASAITAPLKAATPGGTASDGGGVSKAGLEALRRGAPVQQQHQPENPSPLVQSHTKEADNND